MLYRLLIAATAAASLALSYTCAADDGNLSQTDAESRLRQLTQQIGELKKDLEQARGTLSQEQRELEAADLRIQASMLALRQLELKRQEHSRELAKLEDEQQEYLQSIDERRAILARQILTAYRLGRESRLKLVLNQDSPAELSRTLAYYDYFSRSQAEQISELRKVLLTLDEMQASISAELLALDEVQTQHQQVLDQMTMQREQRQAVIDELSRQIGTDEQRLAELQRNRRDLEVLLQRLSDVLADIPADLGQRLGPAQLKGKLPMPVDGRVRYSYGQARTTGLHWQGWLIGAGAGSEVRAVAYGRVAFSDWLRGYGLLMIIDHGDGFMTLYGNNESLLFEVGDWVEPGSVISTVGAGPLSGTGLYFEIRRNGKALDPAVWLNR
ncbi:MAG: peptidoglycan DD-metalloendopeptidase family protein [Xanthomonadales bacterium]|nr:peptidoglycan DD-metalloendopeptidase family protein [Xanthomonadales bacterium]